MKALQRDRAVDVSGGDEVELARAAGFWLRWAKLPLRKRWSLLSALWTSPSRWRSPPETVDGVQAHAPRPTSALPRTVNNQFTSVTIDPVHFT